MKKIFVFIVAIFYGVSMLCQTITIGSSGGGTNTAAVASQIADSNTAKLANATLGATRASFDSLLLVVDDLKAMLEQLGSFDLTPPVVDSIEIGRYNDSILVVFMDTTDLDGGSVPNATDFELLQGATEFGIHEVAIAHDSVLLALDSLAVYGQTYTLSYISDTPALQDSTGNNVASFSGHSVLNYVTLPADTLGEEMISNGIFADGTDWNAATGWAINAGVATYDDINDDAFLTQTSANMVSAIEPNTLYRLTLTNSIDVAVFNVVNSIGSVEYAIAPGPGYSIGEVVIRFTTPSDIGIGGISFLGKTFSASTFNIDNISLKKVL